MSLDLRLPSDADKGWIVPAEQRVPFHKKAFIPYRNPAAPFRLVWHQTQTISPTPEHQWRAYENHRSKPQLWVSFSESNGFVWGAADRWGNRRKTNQKTAYGGHDTILQSVPLSAAGWALKNSWKDQGWETNHQNCVQVEFEGYSVQDVGRAEEEKWAELTALIFLWNEKFGNGQKLPIVPFADVGVPIGKAWGQTSPSRAPKAVWMDAKTKAGDSVTVFSHQNVGSGNDHSDTGHTRNKVICDRAEVMLAGMRDGSTVAPTPRDKYQSIWERVAGNIDTIEGLLVSTRSDIEALRQAHKG